MKKLKMLVTVCTAIMTFFAFSGGALAEGFQEYPIGDEQEAVNEHFKVALVYFQPIQMEPAGMMLDPDKADIHIETDIHATEGNDTGFGVGEWIPYLTVHYKFTKQETGESLEGVFMPMNADDGPHYGANVKCWEPVPMTANLRLTARCACNMACMSIKKPGCRAVSGKNQLL